jgi:hypothetical protein
MNNSTRVLPEGEIEDYLLDRWPGTHHPSSVVESAALFESMNGLRQYLNTEGAFQVQKAMDAHVFAQVVAATPPFRQTGSTRIERVRNAIAQHEGALGRATRRGRDVVRQCVRWRSTALEIVDLPTTSASVGVPCHQRWPRRAGGVPYPVALHGVAGNACIMEIIRADAKNAASAADVLLRSRRSRSGNPSFGSQR